MISALGRSMVVMSMTVLPMRAITSTQRVQFLSVVTVKSVQFIIIPVVSVIRVFPPV